MAQNKLIKLAADLDKYLLASLQDYDLALKNQINMFVIKEIARLKETDDDTAAFAMAMDQDIHPLIQELTNAIHSIAKK